MKFLIKPSCESVKEMYTNHSTYHEGDSGLDLFIVKDDMILAGETKMIDLGISCQLLGHVYATRYHANDTKVDKYYSYNLYARSSICKGPLRLANGVGLCDAGYLGTLKAPLHNTGTENFVIKKGERYVQLARPDLGEISFQVVKNFGNRNTTRGTDGFGSTSSSNIDSNRDMKDSIAGLTRIIDPSLIKNSSTNLNNTKTFKFTEEDNFDWTAASKK